MQQLEDSKPCWQKRKTEVLMLTNSHGNSAGYRIRHVQGEEEKGENLNNLSHYNDYNRIKRNHQAEIGIHTKKGM